MGVPQLQQLITEGGIETWTDYLAEDVPEEETMESGRWSGKHFYVNVEDVWYKCEIIDDNNRDGTYDIKWIDSVPDGHEQTTFALKDFRSGINDDVDEITQKIEDTRNFYTDAAGTSFRSVPISTLTIEYYDGELLDFFRDVKEVKTSPGLISQMETSELERVRESSLPDEIKSIATDKWLLDGDYTSELDLKPLPYHYSEQVIERKEIDLLFSEKYRDLESAQTKIEQKLKSMDLTNDNNLKYTLGLMENNELERVMDSDLPKPVKDEATNHLLLKGPVTPAADLYYKDGTLNFFLDIGNRRRLTASERGSRMRLQALLELTQGDND